MTSAEKALLDFCLSVTYASGPGISEAYKAASTVEYLEGLERLKFPVYKERANPALVSELMRAYADRQRGIDSYKATRERMQEIAGEAAVSDAMAVVYSWGSHLREQNMSCAANGEEPRRE